MLVEEDYHYLGEIDQAFEEDQNRRYLVLKDFKLPEGVYEASGNPISLVDVLIEIPSVYNNVGPDMFWTYPFLTLSGGAIIKAATQGADPRMHDGKVFERWSRHWGKAGWRPRQDNISAVVDRVNWAFRHPDPDVV